MSVNVAGVSMDVQNPKHPELVPFVSDSIDVHSQDVLGVIRWMMQKASIGQDMFLVSYPGPHARRIAMLFCQILGREAEYVCLSRDTGESELKQRREIIDGTVVHVNQSVVDAALNGRVLILDGIERAERNVLPLLNNLLENREMALEDNSFLMAPNRFDQLLAQGDLTQETSLSKKLLRVSPQFLVIAIGLPVPPYIGMPLDPPLRSRFAAFPVPYPLTSDTLQMLQNDGPQLPPTLLRSLLVLAHTLLEMGPHLQSRPAIGTPAQAARAFSISSIPHFPIFALPNLVRTLSAFRTVSPAMIHWGLTGIFPYTLLSLDAPQIATISKVFSEVAGGTASQGNAGPTVIAVHTSRDATNPSLRKIDFELQHTGVDNKSKNNSTKASVQLDLIAGTVCVGDTKTPGAWLTSSERDVVGSAIADFIGGKDVCLVGHRGVGKTAAIREIARLLGYQTRSVFCFKDMGVRDFLQRRSTDAVGNTTWEDSSLLDAIVNGHIAVLDGIDRVPPPVLFSAIHQLALDRCCVLPDGRRVISHAHHEFLLSQGIAPSRPILVCHPNFRILATAHPPTTSNPYLTHHTLTLFTFREVTAPNTLADISSILGNATGPNVCASLARFADAIRISALQEPLLQPLLLSTRQLRHVYRYVLLQAVPENQRVTFIPTAVKRAYSAYLRYLPPALQVAVHNMLMHSCGNPKLQPEDTDANPVQIQQQDGNLIVGDVSCPITNPEAPELVPNIVFYDMAHQLLVLREMLRDWVCGQHLLLVGPQGVGKNKLADRMLQLLGREREYIQLHRDTTLQTLTLAPSLRGGIVVWEDSALVRACKYGRVLVVDEADKAPMEVTCVLKALVEDGELTLGNGRRLLRASSNEAASDPSTIPIHPRFRMIVLANRPGFPFLGNDFYRECGDVFACHSVDNPDPDSELQMLSRYAPNVPPHTLRRLVTLFASLRRLADQGVLSYPYSSRELVHIARHLQRYPEDPVEHACGNVFAFDMHDPDARRLLHDELHKVGLTLSASWEPPKKADGEGGPGGKGSSDKLRLTLQRSGAPDATMPKRGKDDPKNEPHVGGNTWFGGTGGRDTAGLGGKGGPYRVDAGHDVHQLPDSEKEKVSDEAKAAARKLGQEAYLERLREIEMSPHDAETYANILDKVEREIGQLRLVLESHEAKENDRVWLKRQTHGDLDETMLVDGVTGSQSVFKRRGEQRDRGGFRPLHPKRIMFVMDVSASMYTLNHQDGRLNRLLQTTTMLFEAFHGFEYKYEWSLLGHSGDTKNLEFVPFGKPPPTPKERLQILNKMVAHTQHCWSGDNTVEAADHAIKTIVDPARPADEYYVFVISDANLARYGISPEEFGRVLTQDKQVHAHVLFIASAYDSAEQMQSLMPAGKAHVCLDTAALPRTLKQIFVTTMLRSNL
eukprot:c12743_g1_i1.p1 GENE.c12743_g1_i1~~c12743_g1_i1.p1  ORF type:complete len:1447 (+),score=378.72 c12743_g1_i1:119-4342(+)